jgi:hypothetical protein
MKQRRDPTQDAPSESRLSGVRAMSFDDDDRPSREDRTYGETIFNRAVVPLPRFLRRRRKPQR